MNSDGRVRVDSEFLFFLSLLLLSGNFHHTRLHTHNTLQVPMADKQDNKKKKWKPTHNNFFFIFIFIFDNTFSYKSNQINKPRQPRQPRQPSTSTATTLERKVFNKRINTQTHIYNKVQTRYFAHFDIISIILLLL